MWERLSTDTTAEKGSSHHPFSKSRSLISGPQLRSTWSTESTKTLEGMRKQYPEISSCVLAISIQKPCWEVRPRSICPLYSRSTVAIYRYHESKYRDPPCSSLAASRRSCPRGACSSPLRTRWATILASTRDPALLVDVASRSYQQGVSSQRTVRVSSPVLPAIDSVSVPTRVSPSILSIPSSVAH